MSFRRGSPRLNEFIPAIQTNANQIARWVFTLVALVAEQYNYVRPVIHEDISLDIRQGRHPVIERQMPIRQSI